MAPALLQLTLFEPVVFLRGQSAVGEDARGRRRPINFDAPPSQLRGLLKLTLPKPSKIKEISILLQGRARTDWPEGIGPNRLDNSEESIIFSQKIILYSAKAAQPGQTRGRSNSLGTLGTLADETREDRRRMDRSFSNHGIQSTSSSLPRNGGRLNEGERSPTLARSIGNAAARAGTAILPPTLIRELNASKQASISNTRSASSSPMRSPSSLNRLGLSRATSNQNTNSYFDPPPVYGPSQHQQQQQQHQHLSPSPTSSHPSTPIAEESFSSSAPGRGPEDWGTSNDGENSIRTSINSQHPQSISAAGPSNRSILHPPGRQEGRQQSISSSGAGVRFDPQSINAGLQQQQQQGGSTSTNDATSLISNIHGYHSEPNSTRTSFDRARSPSTSGPFGGNGGGKGKGKAINSSSSPGAGSRKGIKGLLGNLLKEDDEIQRGNTNGNTSNGNHSNQGSNVSLEDEGDCKEFKKGVYTYPFSIPLPSNLPPTLHADFGSNTYVVRAHVHRAGTLTSNLTSDKEIILVHAPDEDGQDENDAIVVERNWDDCLRYIIVVMGKSFPVGSKIPVWVKFVPTEKVRIHRIIASIEERTAYFAKGRRVARHEVPRKWNLLKLLPSESSKEGILPIISDDPDALLLSPVTPFAQAAARYYTENVNVDNNSEILTSLMDPFGPWELAMDLEVPTCGSSAINISTNHKKSNIAVSHLVKLAIRVERLQGDGSDRKLFDILIEAPVTINHSHTANAWLSLPDYWSVRDQDERVTTNSTTTVSDVESNRQGSSASIRRQTAPSLTPGRNLGTSRVEAVTTAARPTSPTAPPLQGRVNNDLIQLSQQWLSLSANAEDSTNNTSRVMPSMTTVEQQQQDERHTGLPTYAMIDNARGSVDLPGRSNQASAK